MIEPQDILVKEGEVVTLANGAKLIVLKVNGSRPSAITIGTEGGEIEIADFAGGRFSTEVNCLVPTCEVVIWSGKAFIVGLPAIVVAGRNAPLKCDLFRNAGEDTGFYATEWKEIGERLFCIYESGVMAWSLDGVMLWHVRKSWDEVFSGVEANGLILIMEDGRKILIDQTDGSRIPPPYSPPP